MWGWEQVQSLETGGGKPGRGQDGKTRVWWMGSMWTLEGRGLGAMSWVWDLLASSPFVGAVLRQVEDEGPAVGIWRREGKGCQKTPLTPCTQILQLMSIYMRI